MSVEYEPIPDLLRRFVPTPLHFDTGVDESSVRLETNDRAVLDDFQSQVPRFPKSYTWKLIRDEVPTTGNETTVLVAGALTLFVLGAETYVVIDWRRRQVLGFVAADIDAAVILNHLSSIFAASSHTEINDESSLPESTTL